MGQSFRMRTILVCSFAFFLLAIVSEETTWSREIPTRSKVEEIEKELDKVIEKKKLPAAVRLAFHDCVGGCDGCIDPDKPANAGLEPFVKALEPTFKRYENFLTRADFWALTSIFALKKTIKINNQLCQGDPGCETPELNLEFKYGREDCKCPTAPFISREVGLPDGKFGFKETMQFFKDKFDFTGEESVALLGAHTLGRAMTPEREDPHWQWRIPIDNVTFILNPDVALCCP